MRKLFEASWSSQSQKDNKSVGVKTDDGVEGLGEGAHGKRGRGDLKELLVYGHGDNS